MHFSQDFIEKVRESNNIVDIIGNYTQLKRKGARLFGLCPFPDHNEKTASFSVTDDLQLYHCFGCKKSGNIYTFVQEIQGLSFPEAVEFLANRAALPIPEEAYRGREGQKEKRDIKKVLYKVNERSAHHFHSNFQLLKPDSMVKDYCRRRGLSKDIIEKFMIGYAADSWNELVQYLERIGAPIDSAEKLGLVRHSSKNNSKYDFFRHRLIFPIISPSGQVLGFGGRILDSGNPKYLNSPDSAVFHKGTVFYGLNETAKYIRTEDQVIVVEGYMDLIALYKAGIKNVVAPLGVAFTKDHAKLIKRYTKNVIVLFDGDESGKEAAERALPILLSESLLPKALFLPNSMDPDDFINEYGVEKLQQQLQKAPELFTVVLEEKLVDYKGQSTQKVALMDQMAPLLLAAEDERLRQLYVAEMVDRLDVEATWVRASLKKGTQNVAPSKEKVTEITPMPAPSVQNNGEGVELQGPFPKAELFLLNLALMKPKFMDEIADSGVAAQFSHRDLAKVLELALAYYRQDPSKFDKLTALLVSQVKPPEVVSKHLDHPLSEAGEDEARKMIMDCSHKVQRDYQKRELRELHHQLKTAPSSEHKNILERIVYIQTGRRGPRLPENESND